MSSLGAQTVSCAPGDPLPTPASNMSSFSQLSVPAKEMGKLRLREIRDLPEVTYRVRSGVQSGTQDLTLSLGSAGAQLLLSYFPSGLENSEPERDSCSSSVISWGPSPTSCTPIGRGTGLRTLRASMKGVFPS